MDKLAVILCLILIGCSTLETKTESHSIVDKSTKPMVDFGISLTPEDYILKSEDNSNSDIKLISIEKTDHLQVTMLLQNFSDKEIKITFAKTYRGDKYLVVDDIKGLSTETKVFNRISSIKPIIITSYIGNVPPINYLLQK